MRGIYYKLYQLQYKEQEEVNTTTPQLPIPTNALSRAQLPRAMVLLMTCAVESVS